MKSGGGEPAASLRVHQAASFAGPRGDDQFAQPLRHRDEVGRIGHFDRARPRKRHFGVVDDLARPRPHHADAVGEIAGFLQIVGDEQHRGPQLHPQLLHDRPQFLAGELIERAERLVEHQKLRLVHQRAAQRGALQHAAGQLPGMLVAEIGEPDFLEQRFGAVAKFGLALGAVLLPKRRHDLQRQHDVVAHRQPRQHGRVLERHADAHRLGADLAAGDIDVAGARVDQPGHELEDGRLAAAGRTDQRDEIALLEAQVGQAERVDLLLAAPVGQRHVLQARRKYPECARLGVGWRGHAALLLAASVPLADDRLHRQLGVAHRRCRHVLDRVHRAAPAARAVDERAVLHDEAAAHQRVERQAFHAAAVPRRDFRARLQRGIVDGVLARKIDDREIGIGTGRNRALARIEAPDSAPD